MPEGYWGVYVDREMSLYCEHVTARCQERRVANKKEIDLYGLSTWDLPGGNQKEQGRKEQKEETGNKETSTTTCRALSSGHLGHRLASVLGPRIQPTNKRSQEKGARKRTVAQRAVPEPEKRSGIRCRGGERPPRSGPSLSSEDAAVAAAVAAAVPLAISCSAMDDDNDDDDDDIPVEDENASCSCLAWRRSARYRL